MEKIIVDLLRGHQELASQGRTSESLFVLQKIALESLNLLGITTFDMNSNWLTAMKYLDMAKAVDGGNWMVYSNMSHVYNKSFQFEKAEKAGLEAVKYCNDECPDPYYNLAVIQANLLKIEEAIAMYRKAISLAPERTMFHFNLGCELIKSGQWEEGWKEYDSRIKAFPEIVQIRSRFKCPDWDGSPVESVYIYSEQGLGDLINFMRYLPMVKERVKHVIVEAQKEMGELLKDFPGVDELVLRTHDFPNPKATDAVASICSLPRLFSANAENISGKPYINIKTGKTPKGISSKNLNIGIVWAGNPKHPNDQQRSFYLKEFQAISELKGVKLFSLQKDNSPRIWGKSRATLLEDAENLQIEDLGSEFKTFLDCAKAISHMDLVITADTSVAHLAGAMGKPTYILLPYCYDFRWTANSNDSVWYDSVKLFRQTIRNDWTQPFQELLEAVKNFQDQKLKSAPKSRK